MSIIQFMHLISVHFWTYQFSVEPAEMQIVSADQTEISRSKRRTLSFANGWNRNCRSICKKISVSTLSSSRAITHVFWSTKFWND